MGEEWAAGLPLPLPLGAGHQVFQCRSHGEFLAHGPRASCLQRCPLPCREALQGQLMPAEQDEDAEGMCKPLSCGWEITDTLCMGPVFTPASIM